MAAGLEDMGLREGMDMAGETGPEDMDLKEERGMVTEIRDLTEGKRGMEDLGVMKKGRIIVPDISEIFTASLEDIKYSQIYNYDYSNILKN